LLTHSACYYAQSQQLKWTKKVKNIFLLATPHLGSFLEKFANVTTNILEKIPNWPTRMVGKVLNLRSAGIKDLRFGYLTEEEWNSQDPDKLLKNNKKPVSKLTGVNYYVISGRLTKEEKHWLSYLFGDILVSKKSATGQSKNIGEFNFPPENHYEFAKMFHFELNTRMEVYEKIRDWMKACA
jgi:triacylglycerol lipase